MWLLNNFVMTEFPFCHDRISSLILVVAELFVATYKYFLRQTCLGLSQFSFIFCRDIIFFCHNQILLLCSFYYRDKKLLCRNRDSTFSFSLCRNINHLCRDILLVLLFKFLWQQRFLCRDRVHLNLMFCLS